MFAFDRDGCVIGTPYDFKGNHPKHIVRPDDQVINPVVAAFMMRLPNRPVIISNQAGCKWGYKTEAAVIAEMRWLMRRLPIACSYFCPDEGDRCVWVTPTDWGAANQITHPGWNFRKPSAGMFQLARQHGYKLTHYVGDMAGWDKWGYGGRDSDFMAAHAARCDFVDVRDLPS